MKEYTITCVRTENPLGSPNAPNWEFPIERIYEAETKASALDMFQHDVFYEAKKNGYRIHHYNKKEMAFVADISIYGQPESYPKHIVFENIKVKENKDVKD